MTPKQLEMIKGCLDDKHIQKLSKEKFKIQNEFINFFISTNKMINSLKLFKKIEATKEEIKDITTLVNNNKEKYTGIVDEYCSFNGVYVIPNYDLKIYRFEQVWFKGMSNTSSRKCFYVLEDGSKPVNIYNYLLDMGIDNLYSFMCYLRDNDFKSNKEVK